MFISLKSILSLPEFKSVEFLAGKEGTYRNVSCISTNDLRTEYVTVDTIGTGDLYISSLHQFVGNSSEDDLYSYIMLMINKNCSGLVIVSLDNVNLITNRIRDLCNQNKFPLLLIKEPIKYSELMTAVNQCIILETYNASRVYRIQKILSENLNEEEILAILNSLESGIEEKISVIAFGGINISEILSKEFCVKGLMSSKCFFVDCGYIKYYVVSGKNDVVTNSSIVMAKQMIKDYFDVSYMGISRSYEKRNFKVALVESYNAYKIAKSIEKEEFIFPRVSSYSIVASTAESSEAKKYYNSILNIIMDYTTEEHSLEILETVRAFVNSKGDYKKTADKISQHENTVRYRINKLKSWLDMEDSIIEFYETLSLLSKYSSFYY